MDWIFARMSSAVRGLLNYLVFLFKALFFLTKQYIFLLKITTSWSCLLAIALGF